MVQDTFNDNITLSLKQVPLSHIGGVCFQRCVYMYLYSQARSSVCLRLLYIQVKGNPLLNAILPSFLPKPASFRLFLHIHFISTLSKPPKKSVLYHSLSL